jgi:catechol 2,3-dioxygenase-like lactoylglutathione lyase family enzyme
VSPATSAESGRPAAHRAISAPTQKLEAIAGFGLVTADLPRLVRFYRAVLGFAAHGDDTPIDVAEIALLKLSGRGRRQVLSLGRQILSIDEFEQPGRPYPAHGDAASLWFQHLALIVPDMREAYARLRDITSITQGEPQQLPRSDGSVLAFKFRDPDLHPLELLQFPDGRMPEIWWGRAKLNGQIGLGIDHSAISVADADVSADFYRSLGLSAGDPTLNHGPAQQRLDGLPDVEVMVVPMNPAKGAPHLELLGYRTPKGEVGLPLKANDVAATRIVWRGQKAMLITDPDGHLHEVQA